MPFEANMEAKWIRARLFGIVTNDDLILGARRVAEIEDALPVTPPRITDLTPTDGLLLTFREILSFAEARRSRVYRNPIKSALVVGNDVQRGFARMFQTLMGDSQITVEIFTSVEAAEAWLLE